MRALDEGQGGKGGFITWREWGGITCDKRDSESSEERIFIHELKTPSTP